MTRRRPIIVPRRPIFLGCEGQSEASYGALLNRLSREVDGLHIHIHVEILQPGAGDPHALALRAAQKITELERRRESFAFKAIILDQGAADKNAAAIVTAQQNSIDHVIWQRPDHEAFLLRHLDGCQQLRPPAGASFNALNQRWPEYRKAIPQMQLAERISIEHIRRAATVEDELRVFLAAVGLL